jgi:hypothetical protein
MWQPEESMVKLPGWISRVVIKSGAMERAQLSLVGGCCFNLKAAREKSDEETLGSVSVLS